MTQKTIDKLLGKLSRSWKVRNLFTTLQHTERSSIATYGHDLIYQPSPYRQDGVPPISNQPALFLTSRFRTGSTLLWQLMNMLDNVTCYYEPLNARIWPHEAGRAHRVDPTHKGAHDYAAQYSGLTHLTAYHRQDWSYKNLWMDEYSADWNMLQYIQGLIDATDDLPVLQFNRVDFRLQWLRQQFPGAKIIHLIRSPRDQWISSLYGQNIDKLLSIDEFAPYDKFYLLSWVKDLRTVFPVLNLPGTTPAYCLFYLLWRLSYLQGYNHADLTLQYEDLINDVNTSLKAIIAITERSNIHYDATSINALITKPKADQWTQFAPQGWFEEQESAMEQLLYGYLNRL